MKHRDRPDSRDYVEDLKDLDNSQEDNVDEFEFDEDDEYEDSNAESATGKYFWRKAVVCLLVLALFGNMLAFWPQIYQLQAIQFWIKSRELSKQEHIGRYKRAVVTVRTDRGKGTGFHVGRGYIVTNHHVIEDQDTVFVQFPDGRTTLRAEMAASDPAIDIALLKADIAEQTFPSLQIGQNWEPSMHVYVIGNPLSFYQIANEGTVLGTTTLPEWDVPVMAIQAPVFQGNSGSPVINENGQVIAVVFATAVIDHRGKKLKVGLAVPAEHVLPYLPDLPEASFWITKT